MYYTFVFRLVKKIKRDNSQGSIVIMTIIIIIIHMLKKEIIKVWKIRISEMNNIVGKKVRKNLKDAQS